MMTNEGGTVRYHRADWLPERNEWEVQFTPKGIPCLFTPGEGEAMGLTPPEPALLVVTCNGQERTLSDAGAVERFIEDWLPPGPNTYHPSDARSVAVEVARLLRDARQDDRSATRAERDVLLDVAHAAWELIECSSNPRGHGQHLHLEVDHDRLRDALDQLIATGWEPHEMWSLDGLPEDRPAQCSIDDQCPQSTPFSVVLDELIAVEPDEPFSREDVAQSIVGMLEVAGLLRDARQDPQPASRPHIDTETYPVGLTFSDVADCDEQPWPDPQPERDDTPGIDFDALPIGTEMEHVNGDVAVRRHQGWWNVTLACWCDPTTPDDWRVVYQPAPLSPGECLRGLLAGRDDADELIEWAARSWPGPTESEHHGTRIAVAIGDAAREVRG